jgi:hypothetical protein
MNRYVPFHERNELINRDYIEQRNTRLNNAVKGVYLAKMDKSYDISWCSYVKSYFVDTQDSRILREMSQVEQQLRNQLAILHNNTWEQWGWAAARYSAVVLATVIVLKESEIRNYIFSMKDTVVETAKNITA